MGRIIEVLLYDLTGNFRHTNTKIRFKITSIVGEKCLTRFFGMELTRDYIRSVIHQEPLEWMEFLILPLQMVLSIESALL